MFNITFNDRKSIGNIKVITHIPRYLKVSRVTLADLPDLVLDTVSKHLSSVDYQNLKQVLPGRDIRKKLTKRDKFLFFIEKHIDKDWNWGLDGLSSNPVITPQFIEKYLGKDWWWGKGGLSSNPSITPEFIEKHINKDWDWGKDGLSSNKMNT
jgi:hypothetical protein